MVVQVLDDLAGVTAIRDEWTGLCGRFTGYRSTSGFDYATLGWAVLSEQAGDRLAVVTVRQDGRLVGLWPLFVRREPRKSVATHLGNGSGEEYASPLIEDGPCQAEIAALLLRTARGLADLLMVRNLPHDGLMAATVKATRAINFHWEDVCSIVSLQGVESFETWVAPKSSQFRYDLRKWRRRLAAQGPLESRAMAGPVDGPRFADWLIRVKREWARERSVVDSWLYVDQAHHQISAVLSRPGQTDAFGQAILLNDQIIAGAYMQASPGRLEFFITAYDPAYAKNKPGILVIEDLVRLGIARDLDLDLRIMETAYKDRWADRRERVSSFWVANSWRGVRAVLAQRIRVALRGY